MDGIKLEVGQLVKLRDGNQFRVLANDDAITRELQPFLIDGCKYTPGGRFYRDGSYSMWDVVEIVTPPGESHTVTRWVNVYQDDQGNLAFGGLWDEPKKADSIGGGIRFACKKLEFVVTKGEGLECHDADAGKDR